MKKINFPSPVFLKCILITVFVSLQFLNFIIYILKLIFIFDFFRILKQKVNESKKKSVHFETVFHSKMVILCSETMIIFHLKK